MILRKSLPKFSNDLGFCFNFSNNQFCCIIRLSIHPQNIANVTGWFKKTETHLLLLPPSSLHIPFLRGEFPSLYRRAWTPPWTVICSTTAERCMCVRLQILLYHRRRWSAFSGEHITHCAPTAGLSFVWHSEKWTKQRPSLSTVSVSRLLPSPRSSMCSSPRGTDNGMKVHGMALRSFY